MNKDFNVISVINPTGTFIDCIVNVTNLKDGRIKVVTEYKNGSKPYEDIMSIDSEIFESWYKLNEYKLVIQ